MVTLELTDVSENYTVTVKGKEIYVDESLAMFLMDKKKIVVSNRRMNNSNRVEIEKAKGNMWSPDGVIIKTEEEEVWICKNELIKVLGRIPKVLYWRKAK